MYIYGNHRNFKPIHFSSYGNLKVILETTFRHLPFSSFILTSSITSSIFAVKFYSFALEIDELYIYAHTYVHTCTRTHIHIHIYIHTLIHTYKHTYTYIHITTKILKLQNVKLKDINNKYC